MSGVGLIGALVIGVLAGWIAEKVMSRNHGLLTNLIVGVIGSSRLVRWSYKPPITALGPSLWSAWKLEVEGAVASSMESLM